MPVFPSGGQLSIFLQSECCAWATSEGVPMNEGSFAPVLVDINLKPYIGLGSAKIERRQQTYRASGAYPQQVLCTFALAREST